MPKYRVAGTVPRVEDIVSHLRQALPDYEHIALQGKRVVLRRSDRHETHCYPTRSLIKISSHFPPRYIKGLLGLLLVSGGVFVLLLTVNPMSDLFFLLVAILPASGFINFFLITNLPDRQQTESEVLTAMQQRWPSADE